MAELIGFGFLGFKAKTWALQSLYWFKTIIDSIECNSN